MQPAQDFKYKGLINELHVGDVYLRVYNEQPDFEIIEGELFCKALVDFISGIVEVRKAILESESSVAIEPETPVEINTELSGNAPPPVPASPEQNQTGEEQGEESEREVLAAASDVEASAQLLEGKTLVKNLTMALNALQVWLNSELQF